MPVRAVRHALVVCDPGPETARSSGTADVEINACLEASASQRADGDFPWLLDFEQYDVGSRGGTE